MKKSADGGLKRAPGSRCFPNSDTLDLKSGHRIRPESATAVLWAMPIAGAGIFIPYKFTEGRWHHSAAFCFWTLAAGS